MANVYGKIWRTVVFSGAMLGGPLAAADAPAQKPSPPAKATPKRTVDQMEKDLALLDKKIAAAIDAVAAAQNDKDRSAATAKLDALRKEKAVLQDQIAAAKAGDAGKPKTETTLDKLQGELDELNKKISKAVDAVVASQSDAERTSATAKLKALQKTKTDLEGKIAAEKARLAEAERNKNVKRPRAKEDDRPIGRGFILS